MTEPTSTDPAVAARRRRLLTALAVGLAVVAVIAVVALTRDDDTTTTAGGSSTAEDGGATPEEIMAGQQALQDVGCYTGPVDGVYGPASDLAIRDFQSGAGLTVDGIFGPATLTALEAAVAAGETVCDGDGATPEEIMAGQQALQDVGCYIGPVDGVYGPASDLAIRDFQSGAGLTVDGIFGPATLTALEAAVAAGETVCDEPASAPTVRLATTDGLDEMFEVTSCVNPGETDLQLEAQTNDLEDPIVLNLDATGGSGTITLSGSDEREGTVDELMVGDTGEISASGQLSVASDAAPPPADFELTGSCA